MSSSSGSRTLPRGASGPPLARLLEAAPEVEEVVRPARDRYRDHRVDEHLHPGVVVIVCGDQGEDGRHLDDRLHLAEAGGGMTTPCWPAAMRRPLTANSRAITTIATQAAS